MIARCEPECFHRAIYYIKNLSHKQGHNRKENVIVSTEKIRKTGGNNVPLVEQEADAICIAGNTVDRQPQNGGNGLGCQDELAYTLTATDRHAVYSRQRVDAFKDGEVVSTQSARQYKDATDLVMDVAGLDCRNGSENGDLCGTLQKGTSGSSLNSIHPVRNGLLIRRLTPLECERLQGFLDGWTNIPNASDSARYKALGNSVYLIMVVMRRTDVKTAPGEDSWRSCFT